MPGHIVERQNGNGGFVGDRRWWCGLAGFCGGWIVVSDRINSNRRGYVLDFVRPAILVFCVDAVAHLFVDTARNADPAWIGKRFNAGRNIHPFAVNVASIIDDIAEMDPNAKIERVSRDGPH